jgi:hypothetical protein
LVDGKNVECIALPKEIYEIFFDVLPWLTLSLSVSHSLSLDFSHRHQGARRLESCHINFDDGISVKQCALTKKNKKRDTENKNSTWECTSIPKSLTKQFFFKYYLVSQTMSVLREELDRFMDRLFLYFDNNKHHKTIKNTSTSSSSFSLLLLPLDHEKYLLQNFSCCCWCCYSWRRALSKIL